ncbi:hypothetical protein [Methylobacterium nonmethylotrophicum]|nr:hypothetical protein [Methylobacterium nonmethylotrophicum]
MASSPSITATRPTATRAKPGLLAEMLRLWLEHKSRLAQFGILPL